jgi:N-acetylglucosamine-6-phosphate deacetylase
MALALTGARIFDGSHWLDGHAVVIEGARITALTPVENLPRALERRALEGLLAPGFLDVQVNGGGGVLFNEMRTAGGVRTIAEAHRRFGTTGLLPTFITDSRDRMREAVEAVRDALRRRVPGVLGIHLEGPFINPARKGAHDPVHMRPIEEEDLAIMTSLREGVTHVTLAPECVPPEAIRRLAQAGVVVSAGHTAADYRTAHEAIRVGLRGFTHLYNAMPPITGREPGPVGAALNSRETWCGLIVDGHHVHDASLRLAIAAKGPDRMMLVTDAMSPTGTNATAFDLLGRTVRRENGRLLLEDGTLAGSDLDMAAAVRHAVTRLGLSLPTALHMASRAPAAFLRLDRELGCIAPGFRANLVLLDERLHVRETWIDGESQAA